ncbi:MAG TPA: hypothetical protein DCL77_08615 [Prolixibacteraceae bacterium]|jgi:hypothetical protein|nr:hypothetical protein [Prolixibacteraceae bacterium]
MSIRWVSDDRAWQRENNRQKGRGKGTLCSFYLKGLMAATGLPGADPGPVSRLFRWIPFKGREIKKSDPLGSLFANSFRM